MHDVLVGAQMVSFARELIWSLVYVNKQIVDMIGYVIGVSERFTRAIMIETLNGFGTHEYATVELKKLFLVVDALVDDSSTVMCRRVVMLLDGPGVEDGAGDEDESMMRSNVSVVSSF